MEVGPDGKLTPEMLPAVLEWHKDPHLTRPALVYISNATENGTVYTKAELTALSDFCRANDLLLFVDGARLAAALTSDANDLTLPEFARLVDAFYLGGTKTARCSERRWSSPGPELTHDFFRMKKRMGGRDGKGLAPGCAV